MITLEQLDPTQPDDPAFDPRGAQARRVRRTAVERAPAAVAQRTAPRARRLGLAGALAAATAAVVVALSASGGSPDARAALVAAAADTGAFHSGRMIVTQHVERPEAHARLDARYELRFEGDDLELVERTDMVTPDDVIHARKTWRQFGRIAYTRDDTEPNARFRGGDPVSDQGFPDQLRRRAGSDALLRVARSAEDVTVSDGPAGLRVYRATTTLGAIEDAAPNAAGHAQAGMDRPVALTVEVGPDDVIRRVIETSPGERRTTEFVDLGTPQRIEHP